jgi:hypothetical protein
VSSLEHQQASARPDASTDSMTSSAIMPSTGILGGVAVAGAGHTPERIGEKVHRQVHHNLLFRGRLWISS